MKKHTIAAIAALSLSTGCASGLAKKTATVAVVQSDNVADTLAEDWQARVTKQIAKCRETLPPGAAMAEREECLDGYSPAETEKLIAAVKATVAVQLAVKAAAECEALRSCLEETDWGDLSNKAVDAWRSLKPFVEKLRKDKE